MPKSKEKIKVNVPRAAILKSKLETKLKSKIPKMCLNMIVKDESHIIKETLESISKYIDYWVICDTGSTDNTKQIIKDFFQEKDIPGELYEDTWKDFAHNRTLALERAYKKSQYLWIIDADDVIVGNIDLPKELSADSYYLFYGSNVKYVRTQIINNYLEWEYKGVLHEFIRCKTNENYSKVTIEGNYYVDSRRLGNRNKNPNKYIDDANILVKAMDDEPELAGRYAFYAGQSFKDHGDLENTIKYYTKRIEMGGWIEETYVSCFEAGNAMVKLKYEKEKIVETFLKGFKLIPSRTECLYYLIQYYVNIDDIDKAYKTSRVLLNVKPDNQYLLFVQEDIYKWIMYEQMYDIYCKMDIKNMGYSSDDKDKLIKIILERDEMPQHVKDKVKLKILPIIDSEQIKSLKDYIFIPNKDSFGNDLGYFPNKTIEEIEDICKMFDDAIGFNTYGYIKSKIESDFIYLKPFQYINDGIFIKRGQYSYYNQELINKITKNVRSKNDVNKKDGITLTITTCKRYDLFDKTINSFINCCEDILMIDRFIGIDDNSSQEDRDKMKDKYPFIEWIFKGVEDKGHYKSMNMIIDMIDSEYLLHLEDDWLFYEKMDYITKALHILNQEKIISLTEIPENQNINNKQIKQVIFNRNYIEVEENNVKGGYLCETSDGFRYIIHEYYNTTTDKENHDKAVAKINGPNCTYWAHYSFRPSIIKTDIFKTIGKYSSTVTFFEREYADRYCENGFISCFFDKIICRHIGKLTSEKGDNAYTLNDEKQFN